MIAAARFWVTRRHVVVTASGDRGSIALYFAIITVAALAMAGMVIDGGAALATRERAADVATQAARAGADSLTPGSLRTGPGTFQIDPVAAQQAAQRVFTAAGATGTVAIVGDTVMARATIGKRTVLLSAVGLSDITQTASASARPIYGGAQQEGN